ncbi:TetR family transcriptional regulator [Aneurinibacillus migulanus]|uniref:TetR family transcriptional regulator n=2 Tax=Aneurinibacillus migulanus TaxID=47500 RepID=A0A0D1W3Z6_ANEMI|nr:TetR family transcriptional regulator [Aneurinibacillus migulanus]KIV53045.1 TetR family transcriptional regulator [Aneurinibacillus migulanus]KON90923.1 TetR family transcriptional regulator [Aneurinibacillus migulanus]MED0894120.1 TetR family transcriptional regulator [Aneurinibacillus migulanus]MED1616851.1 TetR family transcriptional regulator [Aneurinibacillus migulanus]SDJ90939.1 transcriptional regulator, TetR family [Aneurinibacillus migulanus]
MSPKVSEEYKREKKNELLQAARRVFIRNGYTHTTMQDIMDEAGVSRGALYSYFDNIEHVFMEVLQFDDQQDILLFEPDDQSSLWTHVTNWIKQQQKNIEAINQSLLLSKAEFFLSSNYVRNKENFPYITERYQRIVDAIKSVIQKGIEQGEFQPRLSPESIALYLVSFLDGLMLNTFQLGSERTNVNEQLTVLLFSLKEMLCPIEEQ